MFGQLKSAVDILSAAAGAVATFKDKRARREAVLELLGTCFILTDVTKDGEKLLDSVGNDPARTLTSLPPEEADLLAREWALIVHRQAGRLYSLAGSLFGQDALALVSPGLKDRLEAVVGSKLERADSLHEIGAGLVYYSMLARVDDREWLLDVVRSMYPGRADELLDTRKAREELAILEHGLAEYRKLCERLVSDSEIVAMAKEARKRSREP